INISVSSIFTLEKRLMTFSKNLTLVCLFFLYNIKHSTINKKLDNITPIQTNSNSTFDKCKGVPKK
ncbi:hypothetical protein KWU15_15575, partial [Clostridioides difficile]|nr:hypothetical protein [Clostridioides difficile]